MAGKCHGRLADPVSETQNRFSLFILPVHLFAKYEAQAPLFASTTHVRPDLECGGHHVGVDSRCTIEVLAFGDPSFNTDSDDSSSLLARFV